MVDPGPRSSWPRSALGRPVSGAPRGEGRRSSAFPGEGAVVSPGFPGHHSRRSLLVSMRSLPRFALVLVGVILGLVADATDGRGEEPSLAEKPEVHLPPRAPAIPRIEVHADPAGLSAYAAPVQDETECPARFGSELPLFRAVVDETQLRSR